MENKTIIYINNKNGEKLTLVGKNGQHYQLKNKHGEMVEMYRIVLSRYYKKMEIEPTNNDNRYQLFKNQLFNDVKLLQQPNELKLLCSPQQKHKRHNNFKIIDDENNIYMFENVHQFADHLKRKYNKNHINYGHLYNLINKKSKSYLKHKLYIE